MSDGSLLRRAVHGVRWLAVTKILSQGFMWVVTIYVIRLLHPEDYGLVALSGLVTVLAQLLLDGGLGAAFVQRQDVSDEQYRAGNLALVLSAVAAVALVQSVAGPVAHYFGEPRLEGVIRIASLQFVVGALGAVPGAQLTRRLAFREIAISQAAAGIGSSLVTLALALAGSGVWSLVLGSLSMVLIRVACMTAYAGRPTGFSASFGLLRPLLSFSGYLIAQRVLWFWVEQADQFIVGRMLGATALGSYSIAKNLSQMPLDRTAETVNQIALPSFAAVQSDPARANAALQRLIRIAAGVAFPLFWGMAAVAPNALVWLLGSRWEPAVVPFMLFCLTLPLRTLHALTGTVLLGLGRADASFRTVVVWALVLTPLFALGAKYGADGVAAAWAVGFPVVYLWSVRLAARATSVRTRTLIKPTGGPAVAAVACAAVAAGIGSIGAEKLHPAVLLVAQINAGAIVYFAVLRGASRRGFEELTDILARLAGRDS